MKRDIETETLDGGHDRALSFEIRGRDGVEEYEKADGEEVGDGEEIAEGMTRA